MQTTELSLRERKKLEREALISETLLDLALEHGYSNVTIEDLANACNISRRTIFNYFESKEDALLGTMSLEITVAEYAALEQAENLAAATLDLITARRWNLDCPIKPTVETLRKYGKLFESEPELLATISARATEMSAKVVEVLTQLLSKHPQRRTTELPIAVEAELTVAAVNASLHTLHHEELPDCSDFDELVRTQRQKARMLLHNLANIVPANAP